MLGDTQSSFLSKVGQFMMYFAQNLIKDFKQQGIRTIWLELEKGETEIA